MTTNQSGGVFWIKDCWETESRRLSNFCSRIQLGSFPPSENVLESEWGGFSKISNMAELSSDASQAEGRWAGGGGRNGRAAIAATAGEQTNCHQWAGNF